MSPKSDAQKLTMKCQSNDGIKTSSERYLRSIFQCNAALLEQYIFIVLFRKPPSYLCDVFAVLVLMPQFIKRPNFLFSVEYHPLLLLAPDTENLKICIQVDNHIFRKNENHCYRKRYSSSNLLYYSNVEDIEITYSNVLPPRITNLQMKNEIF